MSQPSKPARKASRGRRCHECGRPTGTDRGGEFLYFTPGVGEVWLCRRKACRDSYNGVETLSARPGR